MKRVLITGSESTGKSELTQALARHYGGVAVEEYAREYVEKLGRKYRYQDVEHIARWQLESYELSRESGTMVFFDTWLLITRVWFEVVFDKVPAWIDKAISQAAFDLVLLCHTDLPWISDGIRENGGEMREILQERYKQLILEAGWDYALVKGRGSERLSKAIHLIDKHISHEQI